MFCYCRSRQFIITVKDLKKLSIVETQFKCAFECGSNLRIVHRFVNCLRGRKPLKSYEIAHNLRLTLVAFFLSYL